MFNEEFLDEQDNKILNDTMVEFGIVKKVWFRFWSWREVQFDGELDLIQMQAFTKAMIRMEDRHKNES